MHLFRNTALPARVAALVRRSALFVCLLAAGVPDLRAQEPLPSVALPPELDRVLRDYERAWSARDMEAVAALFAGDAVAMKRGQPPARGREAVADAYRGQGGPLYLRALDYSYADSVGFIIGAYRGREDGPDDGKFVLALRRRADGMWMIVVDMDNSNR
jgi:ketosteroid isomerase-like protein